MDDKPARPSRRYVANAVPSRDGSGYLAQYAFPGVAPRYVTTEHIDAGRGQHGKPRVFDDADDAEDSARLALFEALNNRPSENTKRERYRFLTGPEFAEAVRAAGITPTFFCYLWGTNTERFFQWVDETPDKSGRIVSPPHGVRLLLAMFEHCPGAIDLAEKITEQVTTERKPRRQESE